MLPPYLGLHSRGGDDGAAVPVGSRRSAEDHVVPVAQTGRLGDQGQFLRDRQALSGERRLGGLQRRDLDQPRIGGNRVALLDDDNIAGHELRRRDALPPEVADHLGLRGRHLAECRYRLLGPRLLKIAHHRVEQYDREDRDRLIGQRRVVLEEPHAGGYQSRNNQQDHEHV